MFHKHILLFSDFWTSYRFDRGMIGYANTSTPNLHKSTSEPVNITQASHFPSSNLPIARIMPSSKSMQQFSNISESPNTCSPVSTLERSNPQSLDSIPESASSCEKNPVQFRSGNENLNKVAQSENSEMCSKCLARRRVDQTRSKESLPSSGNSSEKSRSFERSMPNTHPRTPSKCNSNLYFTTSIELLNNSENQYFHSNLSDKMSDYEDIWKHSAAATPVPSVKMYPGNVCSPPHFPSTAVTLPSAGRCVEPVYSKPDKSAMNNKRSANDQTDKPKCIATTHNDLSGFNFGPVCSDLNRVESEAVLSTNETDSKSNLKRTLSLDDYKIKNAKRSDSVETDFLDVKSTASVHTQTSPKMRNKPVPLPSVDNDASSTSTALSSAKSPVYAEPFDSLVPPKEKSKKSKVRRRSAPSMGFSSRKSKGVSQTPNLETIFSPKFDHSQSLHESFNFLKQEENSGAMEEGLPPSGLRRTQSAKSRSRHQNEPVPTLTKECLDEVVVKLEKMNLKKNIQVNQKPEVKAKPKVMDKDKSKPKVKSKPGITCFSCPQNDITWEDLSKEEQEVATSTLRKFPVYNHHVSVSHFLAFIQRRILDC